MKTLGPEPSQELAAKPDQLLADMRSLMAQVPPIRIDCMRCEWSYDTLRCVRCGLPRENLLRL